MNIEKLYPELKDMKANEIFIDWAFIVKSKNIIKIHVRKVILKKEKIIFVKALKLEYNVVRNDDPALDEVVELTTIER
jgi:hypothetical protein